MGIHVAVLGRNSRCKTNFLRAAFATEEQAADDSLLDVPAWWTCDFAPKDVDFEQAPLHGFTPTGQRLLLARLRQETAANIADKTDEISSPILLILAYDVVFCRGQPRSSQVDENPIRAAATRLKKRLGGNVPFAIAVSIDAEGHSLEQTQAKSYLSSIADGLAAEGTPMVAVSPRTELWLREQESEGGRVSYRPGQSSFRVRPGFEQVMNKHEIQTARAAFDICGGTGIISAVSKAIALRPPVLVFPVESLQTLQSCGWGGEGAPMASLRICHAVSSGACSRDVFAIEVSEGRLSGELLRAAITPIFVPRDLNESRSLELEEPIGGGAWLLRLTSSHKPAQVWKQGATVSGKTANKALASVQFGDLRSKERRRGRS